MKKLFSVVVIALGSFLSSCENFSNGQRTGFITQFSKTGAVWKSWEGHLNMTQTGMNTSQSWDFSLDNDSEPTEVIATLDSALRYGWKVELTYHQVKGKNLFHNRGHTGFFVTDVKVLDGPTVQPSNN